MKNYAIEIKWGIIFVLMSLCWMLLERLAGLHGDHIDKHAIYTNLIAIPAITIYVLALLDKRKIFYGGSITYMQGFITGLIITLVVTIFSPLTQYLVTTVITPDYFPNAVYHAVTEGKMTQQEAENYFSLGSYILQGLIGAPVMGIITTAIVAIFIRK
jgi:hypothetical protein